MSHTSSVSISLALSHSASCSFFSYLQCRHSINCFHIFVSKSCLLNYNAIDILYHVAQKNQFTLFSSFSSLLCLNANANGCKMNNSEKLTCKYSYGLQQQPSPPPPPLLQPERKLRVLLLFCASE